MSTIVPLGRKALERIELQRACAEYEAQGGEINRAPGRTVGIRCTTCSLARVVAITYANQRTCARCGGAVTVSY
jgi:hypothetical protein